MTRKISTKRKLYNLYCIDRWDRYIVTFANFTHKLKNWYTYSQLIDFKKWMKKRFTKQCIVGMKKEKDWKDYYKDYINCKVKSKL